MAITFYTGDPGAGKSYGVMEHVILQSLKQGRHIVTNIPLYKGRLALHCEEKDWPFPRIHELTIDEIEKNPAVLSSFPDGSVFALDEIWQLWPSGQRVKDVENSVLEFFKMHRHRVGETGHTDQIVLISQNPADVAMWIKNMVTETYWMTKLDKVGRPNNYRVDVLSACPGVRGKKSAKLRQLFGSYKPEVYKFYRSQTQNKSEDWGHGLEAKVDDRANILKSAPVKYGIPAALVLFVLGGYGVYSSWGQFVNPEDLKAVSTVKPASSVLVETSSPKVPDDMKPSKSVARSVSSSAPVEAMQVDEGGAGSMSVFPKPSKEWRLAGIITAKGKGVAVVQGRSGLRRVPFSDCFIPEGIEEYRCYVDGSLVAVWTGQNMAQYGNTAVEAPF
ncbi:MAG: zonular occludens toxin domain-containing protein [Gammaproteobacteria bacterium]|nr:zonular occludens toxin domain-containing protein [Gammaproteobacteria bacterium]MCW8839957.1 zonular occludens toxin domain-containing protein [Gammaproteobacteria bacterium]MCW8959322.1 zonular occludens toxin domain-containing protein [Gammaproteobacteria bacterium]MCW8993769.1 zonular occludens toxin domain-containing protein [Gammaproteobacteria bacterium]